MNDSKTRITDGETDVLDKPSKKRRGRPERAENTVGVYFKIKFELNEKLKETSDNWGVSKTSIVEEALTTFFSETSNGAQRVDKRLSEAQQKLDEIAEILGTSKSKKRL